jgi:hypothetical protein
MSSESVQPDVSERTVRALTEYHSVIEIARGLFEVVSESGNTYRVDLAEPACTCPDFQNREEVEECKHIRRVRLQTGQVDAEDLRLSLATTAQDLETSAEQLTQRADDLESSADKLRTAIERLEELEGER